jgi:hypothetical protein
MISVHIDDTVIRASATLMSRHCTDEAFLDLIADVEKFNHTKLSSEEVAHSLFNASYSIDIDIRGYRTWNPWSKVIGYAEGNTIFVNMRKLQDLDVYERAGNFYHEFCHLAGFSHDGNRVTPYNLNTVPYRAGQIFEDYLRSLHKTPNVGELRS